MFKLLKNKGFSLTEVLVAGFVMSVAGVGMYMGFKSQGDASLFKRRTEKINTLTEDIKQALANNATCVAELGGPIVAYASNTSVNPNPFAGNNIVVNTSLNGAVSTPNLPILTNCNPGVGAVIKSADQLPAPYNGVAINCATMTLGAVNPQNQMARGNITFVFNKGPSGRQVKGGASVVRNIPIIVKLNTANTDIINCSTTFLEETSDEGACEAAGGNWNNDAGLCEMGATNFEEGKFDNDCDDLIGESKNGAGDVSDAINKACRKDEAMCEGVGGCLDWTSPDTGVTTPGCSFPSAGVWSYFGSNPTPYWSACGQKHPNAPASAPTPGACERQRAEECLEGTCGEGCTATGGALWKIDNHDYTITGTALTYGSSPATTARPYNAPVTGAAGTCAVYGQWIDGPAVTCQPHPLDAIANPGSCYDYTPKVCDDPSSQCMGSAANKCDPLDPVLSTITTTCNNTCGGCGGSWAPLNAIDSMCDPTAAQCTVSLTSTTQWNGGPCNTPPPSTPQNVTASNFWVFSCVGTGNGNETICTHQCEIPTSWGDPWLAGTAPGECSATCNEVNLVPSILPGCSGGSQITSTPTSSPPAPTGTVTDTACTTGCASTCTEGAVCNGSGDCPGGTCGGGFVPSGIECNTFAAAPCTNAPSSCMVDAVTQMNNCISAHSSDEWSCQVVSDAPAANGCSAVPSNQWAVRETRNVAGTAGSCTGCPVPTLEYICNNGTWDPVADSDGCTDAGSVACDSTSYSDGAGPVCCLATPGATCGYSAADCSTFTGDPCVADAECGTNGECSSDPITYYKGNPPTDAYDFVKKFAELFIPINESTAGPSGATACSVYYGAVSEATCSDGGESLVHEYNQCLGSKGANQQCECLDGSSIAPAELGCPVKSAGHVAVRLWTIGSTTTTTTTALPPAGKTCRCLPTGQNYTCLNGTWSSGSGSCSSIATTCSSGTVANAGTICCDASPTSICQSDCSASLCTSVPPTGVADIIDCQNICATCAACTSSLITCPTGKTCTCRFRFSGMPAPLTCPLNSGSGSGSGSGLANGTVCSGNIPPGGQRVTQFGNKIIYSCADCASPSGVPNMDCPTSVGAAVPLSKCNEDFDCLDAIQWCNPSFTSSVCY